MLDHDGSIMPGSMAGLYLFGESSISSFAINKAVGQPKIRVLYRLPISIKEIKTSSMPLPSLGDISIIILITLIQKKFFIGFVKCFRTQGSTVFTKKVI